MKVTRRTLQLVLAVLWLVDGALQCQPFMFTRGFAQQVLVPAATGLPSPVASLLHTATSVVVAHPVAANAACATIQLALGVALFSRRFARVALAASIGWAAVVWVVGEGFGGVTAGATFLMGAPGAALLYAVIAGLALPTRDPDADQRPSWLALPAWGALWLSAAVLQFVGGNDSASSISMMVGGASSSAPTWIGRADHFLASLSLPAWTPGALIALCLLIALWGLVPGASRRVAVGAGVVITLASWALVQGFGDLTSGQATDVNTGPLVLVLAVAVLHHAPLPHALTRAGQRLAGMRRERPATAPLPLGG